MDPDSAYRSFEDKKMILSNFLRKNSNRDSTYSLNKSHSNLFRKRSLDKKTQFLNIASFNEVLSVDTAAMVADVEGMTQYESLVEATLVRGTLPVVVPELKTITIGGAATGLGIESSSFRYGLVHESITEMEIILADGQILLCTPNNENKELFFAFPNSYGTLGYALRVKVKLIPAQEYVKVTHQKFTNSIEYFEAFRLLCLENRNLNNAKEKFSFIDGVVFSSNEMYITQGEFVENVPYVSNYSYMQMYYRSLATKRADFLRTRDYIWRWDADWFWCSKIFGMQNRFLRFLLGKFMLHSGVYTKIMHFFHRHSFLDRLLMNDKKKQESVIQDILIPIEKSGEFLSFLQNNIPLSPIWTCPTHSPDNGDTYSFCPLDKKTLYIDFGFWGSVPTSHPSGYYNRLVENKTIELGGLKSLYSSSCYSEEEFWNIYDKELYNNLKAKYDPHNRLRSLFAKCCQCH